MSNRVTAPIDGATSEPSDEAQRSLIAVWRRNAAGARARGETTLLIGAAPGTGLAARGAIRGGCDLLLALNVAKLRSMGAPSIASILPIGDGNRFVMEFATKELLPVRGTVPVFFGASSFDPRCDLGMLTDQIGAAGFEGVVNFPTSIYFDGPFRDVLDAAGVSFSREVDLLANARAKGLHTLAYVGSDVEARQMADIGVDIINLSLRWNSRDFSVDPAVDSCSNVEPLLGVAEAADVARQVIKDIRRRSPDTLCFVDGGPITSAEDMYEICRSSRADGYIGGATLDSTPLETAVEEAVSGFKMVGVLRRRLDELERENMLRRHERWLVGWSDVMSEVRRAFERLTRSPGPLLVSGPPGSGKEMLARRYAAEIHAQNFIMISPDQWLEENLFGVAAGASSRSKAGRIGLLEQATGTTIFIEDIANVPITTQRRCLAAMKSGTFLRLGDNVPRAITSHLIFAAYQPPEALRMAGLLDAGLSDALATREIVLPPLSAHMEDLPVLVKHLLDQIALKSVRISRSLYQPLMSYDWPGNVRELRAVLERGLINAAGKPLDPDHLPPLGGGAAQSEVLSEREWILDGLRRQRFHREKTAVFLGISRKTLYNKMRLHGIGRGRLRH